MGYLLLLFLVLGITFGPQLWVSFILKRYSLTTMDIPGTGGELVEHLLSEYEMNQYRLEETQLPDHFNPDTKTIHLNSALYHGKSLTAIAVAAHEFSHALQHFKSPWMMKLRTTIAQKAIKLEKASAVAMVILPFIGLLSRIPGVFFATVLLAMSGMVMGVLVQLIALPVEWDASFNKALPILTKGGYVKPHQEEAVRKILKAAAITYLAAALRDVLRLGRLIRLLKR